MPPEMIKNESHGVEVDIWSFAICLLELANGAPPHEHSATKAMFIAATEGYPQPFDNSDKWSSDMKNFFAKCLVIDPSKRAKAKELLKVRSPFSFVLLKAVLTFFLRIPG